MRRVARRAHPAACPAAPPAVSLAVPPACSCPVVRRVVHPAHARAPHHAGSKRYRNICAMQEIQCEIKLVFFYSDDEEGKSFDKCMFLMCKNDNGSASRVTEKRNGLQDV